jgi:hypothetical protein
LGRYGPPSTPGRSDQADEASLRSSAPPRGLASPPTRCQWPGLFPSGSLPSPSRRRIRRKDTVMSKVFVDVGLSLEGYLAGPNRGPGNPLGTAEPPYTAHQLSRAPLDLVRLAIRCWTADIGQLGIRSAASARSRSANGAQRRRRPSRERRLKHAAAKWPHSSHPPEGLVPARSSEVQIAGPPLAARV